MESSGTKRQRGLIREGWPFRGWEWKGARYGRPFFLGSIMSAMKKILTLSLAALMLTACVVRPGPYRPWHPDPWRPHPWDHHGRWDRR